MHIYTNILSVIILPTESWTENVCKKKLVGNFKYVGKSVINKFTDVFTNEPCMPKNNYPLQSVGNSLGELQ
jgi:hypothetical protein